MLNLFRAIYGSNEDIIVGLMKSVGVGRLYIHIDGQLYIVKRLFNDSGVEVKKSGEDCVGVEREKIISFLVGTL